MLKCVMCNKSLQSGHVVDSECLEKIKDRLAQLIMENSALKIENKRLKAERNAAVKCLEESENPCLYCRFSIDGESVLCEKCDDDSCDERCPWSANVCGLCEYSSNWEWRGIQEENKNAQN